MIIPDNYLEKVYAGFLGMNIGIRLGAPVEPTIWTYERIQKTYGDIDHYVKDYKNFAADDDVNGPVYFLRALNDDAKDRELTSEDVGRAWLNYTREGVGMFWWGGYGISTEHTAYLNLKNGITAPMSGSMEQNGKILAEQIGGQIFIDTWGLVLPGQPERAADYGEKAAKVSHDGDGVNGARFMCSCISKAFVDTDIEHIVTSSMQMIAADSTYFHVVKSVYQFYKNEPKDWRSCYEMLVRDWGYDKYKGVCHIIPNAGVCVLAMLYGEGNFAKTVEIATMCGWDTDCNAGNVGTILGVLNGIKGLPDKYRAPINDGIILSGISGTLNNIDVPTYAKEVALLGYRLAGEEAPTSLDAAKHPDEIHFDFELPGSTHNMRLSNPYFCSMKNSVEKAYKGSRSLQILVDRMSRGDRCNVFYKPFFRRDEFSDERYSPVLTPTVYSGQKVSMKLYLEQWNGWELLGIAPYVRTMSDKKEHLQGYIKLVEEQWIDVTYTIPDVEGDLIDEVGIVIEGYSPSKSKTLGVVYLDEFTITGESQYTISFDKQRKELGTVTPFSVNHGAWEIEEKGLSLMRCDEAFAYAGNYYASDYQITTSVTPVNGNCHLIQLRAQGAMRGYQAGFNGKNRIEILKNDFGYEVIAAADYPWEIGRTYTMSMKAVGEQIILFINGKEVLTATDNSFLYGMYGCGSLSMGRTIFGDFTIKEFHKGAD